MTSIALLGSTIVLAAVASVPIAGAADLCGTSRVLKSPDSATLAEVQVVNGHVACRESRISFQTHGKVVAEANYASKDGEHGEGLVEGTWTPDSRFFVYDLASSGGHQALDNPIFIFEATRRKLAPVSVSADILPSGFRLLPNDGLVIRGWNAKTQAGVDVRVRLGS